MAVNLYAHLTDYKNFATSRGGTVSADTTDDSVILDLLEQASRYIDRETARNFYPIVDTRHYDMPRDSDLWLRKDLLEVTTLTNGDGTVITDYILRPADDTPYYILSLRDSSNVSWAVNTAGSRQQVITLLGIWGFHEDYPTRCWTNVGTLAAAISDTTTAGFTMTSATDAVVPGQIVKIDNEYFNILTNASHAVTVFQRGDNGSTAATHLINSVVYAWNAEPRMVVLETAHYAYERRFGKSSDATATVTAAGVVLSPRDIPVMAQKFIDNYTAIV